MPERSPVTGKAGAFKDYELRFTGINGVIAVFAKLDGNFMEGEIPVSDAEIIIQELTDAVNAARGEKHHV